MKIFCTLILTVIIAIVVERCRVEFLLVEIDDATGKGSMSTNTSRAREIEELARQGICDIKPCCCDDCYPCSYERIAEAKELAKAKKIERPEQIPTSKHGSQLLGRMTGEEELMMEFLGYTMSKSKKCNEKDIIREITDQQSLNDARKMCDTHSRCVFIYRPDCMDGLHNKTGGGYLCQGVPVHEYMVESNGKSCIWEKGGVKTTVAEDVNELKIEVAKLYKMMRRQIGYCDKYYFGESWRDCKTDEEVTTKDAKCKMPANDATTQSLSSTAQSKDWYCGP